MKTILLIARVLLGLIFLTFGLNGFFHFISMPPPSGLAGQYLGALFMSHFLVVVFLLEIAGGALLLINRYVPLAVALLGPVVVNIVLFHCFMAPAGLPLAAVTAALWAIILISTRRAFAGLFVATS